MTTSQRILYWAPRTLCIAFILFVSMFALDAFQEGKGFWPNLAAFLAHLIPTYILVAMLVLAWRWEWHENGDQSVVAHFVIPPQEQQCQGGGNNRRRSLQLSDLQISTC